MHATATQASHLTHPEYQPSTPLPPTPPCRQDLAQYAGPWPRRTFLAMGSKEYSGIRATPGPQWDDLLVGYCRQLADMLRSKGLDSSRLTWQVCVLGGCQR